MTSEPDRDRQADARRAGVLPRLQDAAAGAGPLPRLQPCSRDPRRHHSRRSARSRAQPDRRGLLRRAGLGPLPQVGAAVPGAPGGRQAGQDVDPPAPLWRSSGPASRVLEVGIGDGENLRFLPESWTVYGVDIAGRSSSPAATASPDERAAGLGRGRAPALPRCDASTPATRSAASPTTKTMPRPWRDAPGHACRRPGRRRRRDARHAPGGPRPPDRPAGPRPILAPPARARRGVRRHGLAVRRRPPRTHGPGLARRGAAPIWNRLGYCLVDPDPDRSPTHDESLLTRIFA